MNINPIFATDAACAAWVFWDARRNLPPVRGYPRQRMTALLWALGVLLCWFAVLPLYLLRRCKSRGSAPPPAGAGRPQTPTN